MLSGGQKQRVAIAGVIAMRPRCIVLDEPTAMLDPVGRSEVLRTVRHLASNEGIAIVHITHFMSEAVYADRVIVMEEGRLLSPGRHERSSRSRPHCASWTWMSHKLLNSLPSCERQVWRFQGIR